MFCIHCKKAFPSLPKDKKCPSCGKTYDKSNYLKTERKHKDWYKIDQGKTRNNPRPKKFEKKK